MQKNDHISVYHYKSNLNLIYKFNEVFKNMRKLGGRSYQKKRS
jgi:hypothetical protein